MDKYDVLLKNINDEAFFKGKQWTEKQIKEMSALKKPAYKINMIGGIEMQRNNKKRNK